MKTIKHICLFILVFTFLSGCCSKEATYKKKAEKAKERIEEYMQKTDSVRLRYIIKPDVIKLGDTATLILIRNSITLKDMRGVIGEYDSNFVLENGAKEHEFYGGEYSASLKIIPRIAKTYIYRGFLEEYEVINDSIEKLYRHQFEITLKVKE